MHVENVTKHAGLYLGYLRGGSFPPKMSSLPSKNIVIITVLYVCPWIPPRKPGHSGLLPWMINPRQNPDTMFKCELLNKVIESDRVNKFYSAACYTPVLVGFN